VSDLVLQVVLASELVLRRESESASELVFRPESALVSVLALPPVLVSALVFLVEYQAVVHVLLEPPLRRLQAAPT
jgi:hypothetical protein